ncbi:MAG: glycoside hydrolase family 99-like domain-containing protein [Lachnospiraceae bacterium]|nr:glycoside hydrolase family 99-like domain-containing protein [Lachnospiraceae bacterium]
MKVMCMYLPQYHSFPENDEWWGKGYTEWTAVKRGRPLFKGHVQPRIPLGERYYDLKKEGEETLRWQAELAKKYGVYGFSFYQYWFKGKQLMESPMETLLACRDIAISYCICWANETWTRTWYGLSEQTLIKQDYGDEADWNRHFDYLLRFFRDDRYIKIDNKPLFMIYRSFDIERLSDMLKLFNERAKEAGFDGIFLVSGKTRDMVDERTELIDGYYYFEPGYSLKNDFTSFHKLVYYSSVFARSALNRIFKRKVLERRIPAEWILNAIENRDYKENEFPGLIPDWDNTPRRSYKGLVYLKTSPERFEKALKILSDRVSGHRNDFVFVNAWNEWGEGAMLEPDEYRGYAYLEAIRRVAGTGLQA